MMRGNAQAPLGHRRLQLIGKEKTRIEQPAFMCVIEIDEPDNTVTLAPPPRSRLPQPWLGLGTVAAEAAAGQTLP
ncbi:hypothetical protein DXU07_11700 [Bradyrhizobium elkanii]|nr:hypothetical protein [Bradyrhizobium elkanii]NWL72116.1 hypothetical protein [Bradyrhizobium elkanii]OIM90994.1 hypothetical protein BLN97_30050 [Bradyrhizobium elkanii]QOZ14856.1 hypothetical protein XI02_07310 [Bradyrhizobium sp. CCBAU 21365]RYM28176.1 hypothetical protein EWH13_12850 [Bradyrhizobium elkanii]